MKKQLCLLFCNGRLALNQDGTPFFLKEHLDKDLQYRDILQTDQADYFALEVEEQALTTLPHEQVLPLRRALATLNESHFPLVSRAAQLMHWHRHYRFCGACGASSHHKSNTLERHCPACGKVTYPRLSPSIMVLIAKGDHVLMARSPHFAAGIYGLIAGFVDPGENLEEAIHREVLEEVGLTVKNIQYYASQSWPFPNTLLMAFFADYAAGEIRIDGEEIEAAHWYHVDNLPPRSADGLSIGNKLLQAFVARQKTLS